MASVATPGRVVPSPTSSSFDEARDQRGKGAVCAVQRREKLDKLAHGIAAALKPKRRRSSGGTADESGHDTVTKPRRACRRAHKRRSSSCDDCASVDSATTFVETHGGQLVQRPSAETLVEEPEPIPEREPVLEHHQLQFAARDRHAEISNGTLALFAVLLAMSQLSLCVVAQLKSNGVH